eukprot:32341-Eustigmatos_ZCMA.PRE.1
MQTRQELSHRDREVAHQKVSMIPGLVPRLQYSTVQLPCLSPQAAEQARVEALTAEARKAAEAKSRDPAVTVVRHQEQNIEQ